MSKFTFEPLAVPDLIVIKPTARGDWRGFFTETFHADSLVAAGITNPIAQDDHSRLTVDYPSPARRPAYSVLANRKFALEQLNSMRPWEDALDDCLLRYREELFRG
jgi:dTDP-4-dehydrorhamnose reductase